MRPHLDDGVALAEVARQAGVPLRTVQRWLACYRESGLAGLARPRSDRGNRALPEQLVTVIEGMALRRPPLSAATIHRQVLDVAGERGWPTPSYATVYAIVAGLDPAMVTLAHEGTKRYEEADGDIVLDPHVTGSCVIILDEAAATALRDLLAEWLG